MALVLAVDDRKDLLDSIASALEEQHSCLLASSGADALLAYRNNRPALVLLDLLMPGMHGREIAQRILEMDPQARIVVFSIVENIREIVELFRQGVSDFLSKPCDPDTLIRIVNANLNLLPEPPRTSEAYASGMKSSVLVALEQGRTPVLAGNRGIGKRTAMREAFRTAGVNHPVVIGPMPASGPGRWFCDCIRLTRNEPGGVVCWLKSCTLSAMGADEADTWWAEALECTRATEGRLAGITVDLPIGGSGSAPLPGPGSGFRVIEVTPLTRRPEDLAAFIAHVETGKNLLQSCNTGTVLEAIENNPSLATLDTVRVMLEVPGFLGHVCGAAK